MRKYFNISYDLTVSLSDESRYGDEEFHLEVKTSKEFDKALVEHIRNAIRNVSRDYLTKDRIIELVLNKQYYTAFAVAEGSTYQHGIWSSEFLTQLIQDVIERSINDNN
jgi:hypothetical protein